MRTRRRSPTCPALAVGATFAALAGAGVPAAAQPADAASVTPAAHGAASHPFFVGERLTYRVSVARVGTLGRGSMTVEGPAEVRGRSTYLLHFGFRARVGPVAVANESRSWLDPVRMTALRFQKRERHPLSTHEEAVELYPEERRWERERGASGETLSDRPLDELSFLYFVRTLPLAPDSVYRFDRHFEPHRNPTAVRMVGREPVVTAAGTFRTLLVEMRVRDARRYRGDGVIWINLTDDACRLPVRIQTQMPVVGGAVLTLESHTHAAGHPAAHAP